MSYQIDWSLLGAPVDVGASVMQGFQTGRALQKQAATESAFAAYAKNPSDPAAVSALTALEPRIGLQIQSQQAETAERQRRAAAEARARELKIFGNFAKAADSPEEWDGTIDQLVALGVPEAAQYKGRFSPETRTAFMAAAGIEDDGDKQTAMQQNYEWLKTVNPSIADQYLQRQVSEPPMIASNGDGTFTVIPRSQMGAPSAFGGPSTPPAPPPPGFVLDNDGGPTPPASGNF